MIRAHAAAAKSIRIAAAKTHKKAPLPGRFSSERRENGDCGLGQATQSARLPAVPDFLTDRAGYDIISADFFAENGHIRPWRKNYDDAGRM